MSACMNHCYYLFVYCCFVFILFIFKKTNFVKTFNIEENFMADLLAILQSVCHIFVKILSRIECSRMIHKIVNKPLDDRNDFDSNRKMYKKDLHSCGNWTKPLTNL